MGDATRKPVSEVNSLQGDLEYEVKAREKHEFLRGEVYIRAGGTLVHARLGANLIGALTDALRQDANCGVFSGDAMIVCDDADAALYPDAGWEALQNTSESPEEQKAP